MYFLSEDRKRTEALYANIHRGVVGELNSRLIQPSCVLELKSIKFNGPVPRGNVGRQRKNSY
jgi:hypothetical protein